MSHFAGIEPGDRVAARDIHGNLLPMRAMTAVMDGKDFPVVWVCHEDHWDPSLSGPNPARGIPWPAEDVERS